MCPNLKLLLLICSEVHSQYFFSVRNNKRIHSIVHYSVGHKYSSSQLNCGQVEIEGIPFYPFSAVSLETEPYRLELDTFLSDGYC